VDILQEFGQDRHGFVGKVWISCRSLDRISTVSHDKENSTRKGITNLSEVKIIPFRLQFSKYFSIIAP